MAKGIGKKVLEIISIVLIITTIISTIVPICSYAATSDVDDEDSKFGGQLFKPISKLVCGMSDGIIMGLQKIFLGYMKIYDDIEGEDVRLRTYRIVYSPRIIFSNKVPALNANFINPSSETYQLTREVEEENLEKVDTATIEYDYGEDDLPYYEELLKRLNISEQNDKYGFNATSNSKRKLEGAELTNMIHKELQLMEVKEIILGILLNSKLLKLDYLGRI